MSGDRSSRNNILLPKREMGVLIDHRSRMRYISVPDLTAYLYKAATLNETPSVRQTLTMLAEQLDNMKEAW